MIINFLNIKRADYKKGLVLVFFIIAFALNQNLSAKTYKVACLHDYYPYSQINEQGEATGIIIDWWRLWSDISGIKVEFIPMDNSNAEHLINSGAADIISGLYYSQERAQVIDFADPILSMKTVLFLKDKLDSTSMKTISVMKGSMSADYIKKHYPTIDLNEVGSFSLLREVVALNEYDGFVYDVPNPFGEYKGMKAPKGYYAYQTLFTNKIRPAVRKGNHAVLNDIISNANKISNDELVALAERYKIYEPANSMLWLVLVLSLSFILIIIFLLIYIKQQKNKAEGLANIEGNTDWQVILDKGENDLIEFKSSLRWDYKLEKPNKALEMVIVKTISAFLNTNGGMLFIGVNDEGEALGLAPDYNSFSKKNRDGFLLALTNLVNQNIGKNMHQYLSFNIISINDKDVCIVNMEKSDKPVFFGKGDKEEFYIRTSASSQPLGIRESYEYIRSNWS